MLWNLCFLSNRFWWLPFAWRSSFDRQRVTHYNVHVSSYDTPRYQTQLIWKFEAHTIIPLKRVESKNLFWIFITICAIKIVDQSRLIIHNIIRILCLFRIRAVSFHILIYTIIIEIEYFHSTIIYLLNVQIVILYTL